TLTLGYTVVLVDRFKAREEIVTDDGFTYHFVVSDEEGSADPGRFQLRILLPGSAYFSSQVPPTIVPEFSCDSRELTLRLEGEQGVLYRLFKGNTPLAEGTPGKDGIVAFMMSADQLEDGNNTFGVEASVPNYCDLMYFGDAVAFDYVPVQPVEVTLLGTMLRSSAADGNQWMKDGVPIADATD